MPQVKWEIDKIELETGRGGTQDSLFANGYMQVSVIVEIKAVDPETSDPYKLTPSDLASLKLIDYNNGSEIGSAPWTYTSSPNEFDHVMPGTLSEPPPTEPSAVPEAQRVTYWVSTTSVEHKSIGAKITQPDGTVITTEAGTNYDSRVVLTGVAAEVYKREHINVDREDTHKGKLGNSVPYKQYNHYVYSKRHSFRKVERHGVLTGDPEPGEKDCCHQWTLDKINWFYNWDMSTSPQTKKVGARAAGKDFYDNIQVNQRPASLCITHLCMDSAIKSDWDLEHWFKIYDRYGNHGSFTTKFSDGHKKLEIVESNNN